jgi:hypothetical protein
MKNFHSKPLSVRKLINTLIHRVMKIRTAWPSIAKLESSCIPNCNEGSEKCSKIIGRGRGRAWWCYVLPHCYWMDHHQNTNSIYAVTRDYTYVLHSRRSHEKFSYLDQRYVTILKLILYTVAALLLLFRAREEHFCVWESPSRLHT